MINPNLLLIENDVMGFLNEIQMEYPDSLSLAAGRPDQNLFDTVNCFQLFKEYIEEFASSQGCSMGKLLDNLGQYSKTRGIVCDAVGKYLALDEKIHVAEEDLLVTIGAQEAMVIVLNTICNPQVDSIAVEDPSYVGMVHLAKIMGFEVTGIPMDSDGIDVTELELQIKEATNKGKPIRILYVIPEYQNPLGIRMAFRRRIELLELCFKHGIYVLEDNTYGCFGFEGGWMPSLKSLDTHGIVIYIGSFSKVIFPGLRLAVLTGDNTIVLNGDERRMSSYFSKTKGYLSVNTPSFNQILLSAILQKYNFSLRLFSEGKRLDLVEKRHALMLALEKYLGETRRQGLVSWNVPKGGFFLTLLVPFEVNMDAVVESARNHGVIFCPMSFFYLKEGGKKEIRLAFSNLPASSFDEAVRRLSSFIKNKV